MRTVTFAEPGRPDAALSQQLAVALGTEHVQVPIEQRVPDSVLKAEFAHYLAQGHEGWLESSEDDATPRKLFVGDGGGAVLGGVGLEPALLAALREGNAHEVFERRWSGRRLRAVIRSNVEARLLPLLTEAVSEEIAAIGSGEIGRDYHLSLIDNDRRRRLHAFYEDLDRTRTELQLPFLDGRLLEWTVASPVDWYLRHDFYHEWLDGFPAPVREVPWQARAGHLPSPVPLKYDALPRVDVSAHEAAEATERGLLLRRVRRAVVTDFPIPLLRRRRVLARLAMHALRKRDETAVWRMVDLFQTTYARCDGRIAWR